LWWGRITQSGRVNLGVAWKVALGAVEDRERRQVLRDTRQAWRDGYERRRSKVPALA
jgi:hypothetical protein